MGLLRRRMDLQLYSAIEFTTVYHFCHWVIRYGMSDSWRFAVQPGGICIYQCDQLVI